jgi:protein-arginine kinase activator protein McsA
MTIDIEELKEIVIEAIENGDFEGAIELADNIADAQAELETEKDK